MAADPDLALHDLTEAMLGLELSSGRLGLEDSVKIAEHLLALALVSPAASRSVQHGRRDGEGRDGVLDQEPALIRRQLLEGEEVVRRIRTSYVTHYTPWEVVEAD